MPETNQLLWKPPDVEPTAVSKENNTVLAIDRSGWLYSWGSNANGLLGNGTDWRQLQEMRSCVSRHDCADSA